MAAGRWGNRHAPIAIPEGGWAPRCFKYVRGTLEDRHNHDRHLEDVFPQCGRINARRWRLGLKKSGANKVFPDVRLLSPRTCQAITIDVGPSPPSSLPTTDFSGRKRAAVVASNLINAPSPMMIDDFRVDLTDFRGPLDLLLYLVRKHEIDVADIPIALITEQYLEYLHILEEIDVNGVGEFLELASTLIEIKSRMVLPGDDEEQDEIDDPRQDLVRRLLQYKKYRDAASMLEERSRSWQQRYARVASDLPARRIDPADQPLVEVELWDLVSALGRVIREHEVTRESSIIYDDTPIQIYMERIHNQVVASGRIAFSESLEFGMPKSTMISLFLAVLELVRYHDVLAEQDTLHGEIWLRPGEKFSNRLEVGEVDQYEVEKVEPRKQPKAEGGSS